MHSQLCIEVGKGVEAMGVVEATLILTVAMLYLAVVAGRVGANQLVPNAQLCGGPLKERNVLSHGLGKAVGELKPVVSLDTFNGKAMLFEEGVRLLQKVCRRTGALLIVGRQITQP